MEKKRTLEAGTQIVTLVTIPRFLPVIMRPGIGEYDSPYVIETMPCEKKNDRYFNLKSGQEVNKSSNMLEWLNLPGTVFRYKDDRGFCCENLLISRRYDNGRLLVLSVASSEVTNMMMLRTVRKRLKEK